eukprot:TRINITY_DN13423_c0_g1_i1.p2 TRINITY_DN13423_c0_g1~~TRINITY_DN13423_c0_g1_i1.p2  ORF type:complete len:114 (+),score=3.32 TRINITY_DN13423_c0_g1_i1:173-514(+)
MYRVNDWSLSPCSRQCSVMWEGRRPGSACSLSSTFVTLVNADLPILPIGCPSTPYRTPVEHTTMTPTIQRRIVDGKNDPNHDDLDHHNHDGNNGVRIWLPGVLVRVRMVACVC